MPPFKVAMVQNHPFGETLPEWVSKAMLNEGIEFVAHDCTTREELAQYAGGADMIWVWTVNHMATAENLDILRRCGAIMTSSSGTDHLPVAEATARGIIVANVPRAPSEAVSEHAIGLLFSVKRTIVLRDRALRAGKWWDGNFESPGRNLRGQTLGLVGFGHIARLIARKLSGFEMTTLVYDPYVSADVLASKGVRAASLAEVLSQSDFVSLHCPLTKETHHLIGERELKMMKPEAVLINTARGPIVDESALVRALSERWIAGAGLDVFEQEPATADNPLFSLDNVVVTPHLAGFAEETREALWHLCLETVLDLAKGYWPLSYVNHEVQSRWDLKARPEQPDEHQPHGKR